MRSVLQWRTSVQRDGWLGLLVTDEGLKLRGQGIRKLIVGDVVVEDPFDRGLHGIEVGHHQLLRGGSSGGMHSRRRRLLR